MSLWRLLREIVTSSPWKAFASIALMLAMTFTEGLGLLLLMPLLGLVGVEEPNTMPNVSQWFESGLSLVGVPVTLGSVLTLYVAITACRTGLQRIQASVKASLVQGFVTAMGVRVYRAITQAEWKFLVTHRTSDFAHVLAVEIEQVGGAASRVMDLIVVLMVSVVYLGVAFHLSAATAVLVLASAMLLAWTVRGTFGRSRAMGVRSTAARRELHAAISEHMAGLKAAKAHGIEGRQTQMFVDIARNMHDMALESSSGQVDLQQRLELGSTVLIAVIVYTALQILNVPAAPMLVLLFTFSRLMPRMIAAYGRIQWLGGVLPIFEHVQTFEQEVDAFAEARHASVATPVADAIPSPDAAIVFDDVTFAYLGRSIEPAIKGLTLRIEPGRTTAIVGPSGAGKSSVADLLTGLLTPTSGRILVGGKPLVGAQLTAWRGHISYVPQDTYLLHDSVRANLLWACPTATDEDLWHALRLASAERFVAQLPNGLDTIIGERGVLLSGGERQRLSLARALVRRPGVLVLDEATSSLDSENERRIQLAVEELHRQMTIVIITHRLSTIQHADRIHVLELGRLIESGEWDQLTVRPGSRLRGLSAAQGFEVECSTVS